MSDSPDPDEMARLERAVLNLPQLQRYIFLAHRVGGLCYREIADRARITVPQAKRHMAGALYKIRKQMDGEPLSWWERWF